MVIRFVGVRLQNDVFQPAKGGLSACKRYSFMMQKASSYDAKGILLEIGSLRGFCLHDAGPVP